ncbi:hypothetical protein [Marinomonas sp. GJ51-6]|uniref:hypothetical protein n=1 Tax=Marinomonas sp. GJ51-6 TaxID=2992802 RepID=UPI002934ED33|nr:hypothetical protein [Marinomonas sp. GJ51-6]WOD06200.1 hypothetical protein ONZ50_10675 [Marinomonas sp. GJ51-6]
MVLASSLARNTTLAGYIETRLSLEHDRQCRNFHIHRLATLFSVNEGDEAVRAKRAIEVLPFVGLVEKYNDSLGRLEKLLESEGFKGIHLKPVEANVSRTVKKSIDEKLIEIKAQLGDEIYSMLEEANKVDLDVWERLNHGE